MASLARALSKALNAMKAVLFLDTNIFMQFPDIRSPKWRELVDADEIELVVSPPVQREISRFKSQGNARRAKKAREANTLFGQVLREKGRRLAVSQEGVLLSIAFSVGHRRNELVATLGGREPEDGEQAVVAEALLYKREHTDLKVVLLTDDILAMAFAEEHGLEYMEPLEEWRLEPEPDESQKKITDLERKLKALEKPLPKIEVEVRVNSSKVDTKGAVTLTSLDETTDSEVEELLVKLSERYPVKRSFPKSRAELQGREALLLSGMYDYSPPTEDEIKEYQDVAYPKWLEQVRKWAKEAEAFLTKEQRDILVEFSISNSGETPLLSCVTEFFVHDGVKICPPLDPEEKKTAHKMPEVPKLPRPPQGHFEHALSVAMRNVMRHVDIAAAFRFPPSLFKPPVPMGTLRSIVAQVPQRRDKHAFYWKEYPTTLTDKWSLECEEFRHKVEPKVRGMRLQLPKENMIDRFAVRCRVTGANLPDPFMMNTEIAIQWERKKAIEVIADILSNAYGYDFDFDAEDDEEGK